MILRVEIDLTNPRSRISQILFNLDLHETTKPLSIQLRHKHEYRIGRKNFRRQVRKGSMPLQMSIKLGSISDEDHELSITTKEYFLHGLVILVAIVVGAKSLFEIFFPKDGFQSPFGRPCWTNWDLDVNVSH